ncbi:MAG: FkbM family methyltransferase, partial [Bacteroidia bacterium]|nr:FkbM family methyltransferase [Bacteroidia bacterium]
LQYLMSRFEYVTTNAFGSHIAYAAYFGAKVSIYGSYAEFKEEDFRHDPFYSKNPKLLAVALNLTSESKVRKELSHLFVLPHKAKILTEWGKYEVGEANKKSVSQLYKILKITFKDRMVATLGRLGSTSKKIIKSVLPKKTRQFINLHFRGIEEPSEPDEIQKELSRISQLPRFIKGETNILGKIIKFVDSASFCFMHNKIFEREVYKFQTKSSRPYIIDAGANVGLSVIYFKKLYPNAEIIALEPDNKIFEVLAFNIKSFGFENVQLIQKALWNEETILRFYSEGADGGRIATQTDSGKLIEVSTCRLRDFLNKKVDLLKMDIEGAEVIVLEDCSDLLHNVERLFVEYHSFVGKEQKLYKLLEILEKAGFRYQVQHVGVFSQHPFIRISEYLSMDLQLNIFAYRI